MRTKSTPANCTLSTRFQTCSRSWMRQESARSIYPRGSSPTLSAMGEDENYRWTIGELVYTLSFIHPSGDRGSALAWVAVSG